MIICLCRGLSDKDIKKYVSLSLLQDETGAGTDCGSCLYHIKEVLEEHISLPNVAGANNE